MNMGRIRNYMIEDLKKGAWGPLYEAGAAAVLEGRAQARLSRQIGLDGRMVLYLEDSDAEIPENYVLAYYLWKLDNAGFDYERAWIFAEKMRKLFGYSASGWGHTLLDALAEWAWDNLTGAQPAVSGDHFKFACYVALSHLKYGGSDMSVTASKIFALVTALGSDLPAQMKKHGSGDIPKTLLEYESPELSCRANDAYSSIKITMKKESKENYERALDFLCSLLAAGFPPSYSLDFTSPEKNYLPIKRLPKKGVNQLFANAAGYKELHGKIERYARLAMKEFEWYTDLEGEHCAMPGTFAVFALGLSCESYAKLVSDYLILCDGEHQLVHGEFVLAYIEKYGFSENGRAFYRLCDDNIQYLPSALYSLYKKAETGIKGKSV